MFEVKKAIAINCFDVLYNGKLVQRFDHKYQANAFKDKLVSSLNNRPYLYSRGGL